VTEKKIERKKEIVMEREGHCKRAQEEGVNDDEEYR
jgi:hypothetical protein